MGSPEDIIGQGVKHIAYRRFYLLPIYLVRTRTAFRFYTQPYAVVQANHIGKLVHFKVVGFIQADAERTAHYGNLNIVLGRATHRIGGGKGNGGAVVEAFRSNGETAVVGTDSVSAPQIRVGFYAAGNIGILADGGLFSVSNAVDIDTRIDFRRLIYSDLNGIGRNTRRGAEFLGRCRYHIGIKTCFKTIDIQSSAVGVGNIHAVFVPLQGNGNSGIAQLGFQIVFFTGTIQIESLIDAYIRRIAQSRGNHIDILHTATIGKTYPNRNAFLVAVLAAGSHTVSVLGGTVRPFISDTIRNGNHNRVAEANRGILINRICRIVERYILTDVASITVHAQGGFQYIHFRIVGNTYPDAVGSGNQGIGRIVPLIAYPFDLIGPYRHHAALATVNLFGNTRRDGRQNFNFYPCRLAVAVIYGFYGVEQIVAFFQSTDIIRIASVNNMLQRKVVEPSNRTLSIRSDFQRFAGGTGTINRIAAQHKRRIGRIVGIQVDGIVRVATGQGADRYRISTVGQVDEVFVQAEALRNKGRIFERGVAVGVNADDTVDTVAGRGNHRIDTVDNGNLTHKHVYLNRTALAIAELLVEIIGVETRFDGERHRIARVNQIGATEIGVPSDFRFLGFRIQQKHRRQTVRHAMETGIHNHGIYRTVGITQTDFHLFALATVVIDHLRGVHTRA